jgi:hypothetical protein
MKTYTVEFLKATIASNDKWAIRAMLAIYAKQTAAEQAAEGTIEDNGVGFSGVDGHILTSMSNQYIRYGRLSPKQLAIVRKCMPKYSRQLLKIIKEKEAA